MSKKVVGNIDTLEIHKQDCPWVKLMNKDNKIFFHSLEEGLRNKFDRCGHCLKVYSNHITQTPVTQKTSKNKKAKKQKNNNCNLSKIYPIDDLNKHQIRRKRNGVYMGEFVQARYTLCDYHHYNTWIIVGLLNTNKGTLNVNNKCELEKKNLGRVGDSEHGFSGWTYQAVDHDVCQIEYGKKDESLSKVQTTLGCCTGPVLSATPSFIASKLGGNQEELYDGTLVSEATIESFFTRARNITYIHFYLLADAHVKLELCLISGEIIKTFNKHLKKGKHKIEWNEKTNTNRIAPAGTYCCKFTSTLSTSNKIPKCIKITNKEKTLISNFIINNNKNVIKNYFVRENCWICNGTGNFGIFPCLICGKDGVFTTTDSYASTVIANGITQAATTIIETVVEPIVDVIVAITPKPIVDATTKIIEAVVYVVKKIANFFKKLFKIK